MKNYKLSDKFLLNQYCKNVDCDKCCYNGDNCNEKAMKDIHSTFRGEEVKDKSNILKIVDQEISDWEEIQTNNSEILYVLEALKHVKKRIEVEV